MKKSLAIACLVSVLAASSFAQSAPNRTPAEVGAQLVAERDAAWQKAHSGGMMVKGPMASHKAEHAKHHTRAKHVKHTKHKIKRSG